MKKGGHIQSDVLNHVNNRKKNDKYGNVFYHEKMDQYSNFEDDTDTKVYFFDKNTNNFYFIKKKIFLA